MSLESRKLATLVKKYKDIPRQDLFQYYDTNGNPHTIGSADINNYLKEIAQEDFTAKDCGAWARTVNALTSFQNLNAAEN